MRLLVISCPMLRRSLLRRSTSTLERSLHARLLTRRCIASKLGEASKHSTTGSHGNEPSLRTGDSRANAPASYAKTPVRRGPPEQVLIYNGGRGKIVFLGMLRITSMFLFGVSCLVVAPAFDAHNFPWWTSPAIVVAGSIPMLYIAYTAAPFVNFIHLALPPFARRSRENAIQYAKNLPPNATLIINTMKITTIPRQTQVRMGDLVPDKSLIRPVSFRNQSPAPSSWRGKTLCQFYASENSQRGTSSSVFYPELWDHVYRQIRSQRASR